MKKLLLICFISFFALHALSQIPTTGLVAYYPFSFNANDTSGNGNNGTVNGTTLTADRFGNQNHAYSFNGINNYIEIADSPTLQFSNQQSVSFWMKISQIAAPVNEEAIIEKINQNLSIDGTGNSAQGFRINMAPDGSITYSAKNGSGYNWQGAAINYSLLSVNQYMLISFITNGDSVKAFLNGVKVNSQKIPVGSAIGQNNQSLLIGKERWTANGASMDYFNGILDDILIYNRALTSQEIQQIYLGCNGTPVASVTALGTTAICTGSDVLLKATPDNATYQWKKGTNILTGATNQTYSTKTSGTYKCVVTNPCGTATSNTITVTSLPNASSTITASGSTSFCAGNSVTLNASNPGAGYTIQWYRNNISINGAIAYSFLATNPGTFKVVIKNTANGCSRISSSSVTTIVNCRPANPNVISGSITQDSQLKLYPNPTAGSFTIEYYRDSEEKGTATIQLINTLGQNIYQTNATIENGSITKEINLGDNVNKGIYIVRIIMNDKPYDSKVMIN